MGTAADVARLAPRRVDVRARPHADLPLALPVDVIKVARGLVQVEDPGEGHISHRRLPAGYRSRVTMSIVRRASSAP